MLYYGIGLIVAGGAALFFPEAAAKLSSRQLRAKALSAPGLRAIRYAGLAMILAGCVGVLLSVVLR
jgi:hypothetical protein